MTSDSMRPYMAFRLSLVLVLASFASAATGASAQTEAREPGWLGFRFTYEETGGDTGTAGGGAFLFVQDVLSDGPAEKGGLEEGDRVLAIDGQPVSRFTEKAVVDFFLDVRRGQWVDLLVERDGTRLELEIEASEVPEEYREARERLLRMRKRSLDTSPPEQSEDSAGDDGSQSDTLRS